jgi:hypothetical protein
MYRQALLRVACAGCGAAVPAKWAELDPSGWGYRCWRCSLHRQIDAHEQASRSRPPSSALKKPTRLGPVVAASLGGALLITSALVLYVLLISHFGRIC